MEKASYIDSNIYVGSISAAQDEDWLLKHNISLIVNCCEQVYFLKNPSIEVTRYRVLDHGNSSILDHINGINQRIHNCASQKKNVLVHCTYGQTRSCSCVIGYFIWKNRWSYDQAYSLVSKQRPVIDITSEYEQYLREYENQLLRGVTNESLNKIHPNCVIELAIEREANRAHLLSKLQTFSSKISVGECEECDGYYGGYVLQVGAVVSDLLLEDIESLESELRDLYKDDPVCSVKVDCLIE